ncbi:MAG TPA: hypothetical protein VHB79_30880 [Polyangiaceae bacterium]|nr:hypothetical protein [Polyangiaceae bacterium]
MRLGRCSVMCVFAACVLAACGSPDDEPSGGAAGMAGKLGQAGSSSGASAGGGAGKGASAGDTAQGASDTMAGGAPGQAGEPAVGGTPGGEAGAPGEVGECVPPKEVPVSGSDCSTACKLIAYEDCNGAGLVEAGCGGQWFLFTSKCGSHKCLDPAFDGQSCGAGQVCALQQGGARIAECRPHSCGTGPITCDCLADVCPGCQQTGALDFTCNTCPPGQQCP